MEDTTPTPTEDPTPTTPPAAPRRRNYSEEDDLILLRQVVADLPFEAQRGGVIEAWDGVVARVLSDPSFGIRSATGKSAQARFNKLVERHRQRDRAALLASGVEEEYGEREQLLDELTSRLDEHARSERERSDAERARLERLATAEDVVREQALTHMRDEESRDETPTKQARLTQLLTFHARRGEPRRDANETSPSHAAPDVSS
jgi:hypothetical protein